MVCPITTAIFTYNQFLLILPAMQRIHNITRGIFQMTYAAISFGIMALFVKMASSQLPSTEIVFFRSLLGMFMFVFILKTKKISFLGKNPKTLLLRGFAGFLALSMHFYAIHYLDLGTAVMLNYTSPIFVAIIAASLLKEKISPIIRNSIFVSFIGLYFLCGPQFRSEPVALILGILSGIFAALAYVTIRFCDPEESPYTIIFYFTFISTLGSIPLLKFGYANPNLIGWIGIIGVTISSFFGQIFLTKSIQSSPVSIVMPFTYLTPVIASLLGMLFWKEYLTPLRLFGGILIIICGVVIYLRRPTTPMLQMSE